MIASLMMYARPELAAPHMRFWSLIRTALARYGIQSPEELSNDADEFHVWRHPELVLSQTCGMPYRKWLHEDVALIGTPDYGLEGCAPGYYRSPIVVRKEDPRQALSDFAKTRFAYNVDFSQSGYASLYNMTQPLGFWFSDQRESGGHQASARMVAEGAADIAALDAVTWAMIQRFDAFAGGLRVLDWTPPTPGLPLIASKSSDAEGTFQAVAEAISGLPPADQSALMLKGLVRIPKGDYLAIPNPPDNIA